MEDIEAILAQCWEEMEQGASLETALVRHSAHRHELDPLLRLALKLREASSLAPSPQFREAAIARLLKAAQAYDKREVTSHADPRFHRWVPNLWNRRSAMSVIVSLLLALVLIGGGGATYASSNSLPGELLYPVKRASEQARLMVTTGEVSRGQLRLAFADERLEEATELAQKDPARLSEALGGYNEEMDEALTILAPQIQGDPALAQSFRECLTAQERMLLETPDDEYRIQAQERLRAALRLANQTEERLGQPETTPEVDETLEPERLREQAREQEELQAREGISATETVSEVAPLREHERERLQEQESLQAGEGISATDTMSEPLQLREREQEQSQEQQQSQQQQSQEQEQQNQEQTQEQQEQTQQQQRSQEQEQHQEQQESGAESSDGSQGGEH